MVWSELDTPAATQKSSNAGPLISPERRGMQNTHLQYLIATADSSDAMDLTADLKNQARFALRELSRKLGTAIEPLNGGGLDFATRAHLSEAKSKIDRTLEKPLVDAGAGGGRIIILQSGQKAGE